MSSSEYLSDEILNAYIDQELDNREMMHVQVLLAQNPGLQRRLHVLQQLNMMVHAAKSDGTPALSHGNAVDQNNSHSGICDYPAFYSNNYRE